MEKDWQTYKKLLPGVRERYLNEKNLELKAILEEENKTETEKFWEIYSKVRRESKIMKACMAKYSRSSMAFQMHLMYGYGMLNDEDLAEFSDELRNSIIDAAK